MCVCDVVRGVLLAQEKEEGNRLAAPVCLCFPAAQRLAAGSAARPEEVI